jgi:hypothetical protein
VLIVEQNAAGAGGSPTAYLLEWPHWADGPAAELAVSDDIRKAYMGIRVMAPSKLTLVIPALFGIHHQQAPDPADG